MIKLLARLVEKYSGQAQNSGVPFSLPAHTADRIWPLPTGRDGAWLAQAQIPIPFVCDAVFMLQPDIYVGPANSFAPEQWKTARVQLPQIDLPRQFADHITTAEALGREDVLIRYYRRIVDIALAYGRIDSLRPFPYFSTKPVLLSDGQVLTKFSWNDDVRQTVSILQIFADGASGPARLLHVDTDQNWSIHIAATGTATALIEWEEGNCPPTTGGYAFESKELASQSLAALERFKTIHDRLVQVFGTDYWN